MRLKKPSRVQLKHMVIVGLLQTTIVFLLVMYGMQFVDAGKSSVLLYSMPIWSSFLAAKILKENISKAKIAGLDRKSTRLNSSHVAISYAVFCLKKKEIE